MTTLPLISYPTKIVILDDDPLFTDALSESLKNDYSLLKFNDPNQCINFFKQYTPLSSNLRFVRGCNELENYNTSGHLPVDIDFSALKEFRTKENRMDEVSVILVDYNMPGMNGLEFCRQLKSLPAKKILLTGEASEKVAVTAFNEGYIDCYIKKVVRPHQRILKII